MTCEMDETDETREPECPFCGHETEEPGFMCEACEEDEMAFLSTFDPAGGDCR